MTDPLGLITNTGGAGSINRATQIAKGANSAGETEGPNFKDVLLDQLREANRLQKEATQAVEDLQTGERNDLDSVILATKKADLAFQMVLEVRNKVMDAYNEVKQIRV
jgi:flagellar hook-basal body complex protein FliE